MVPSLNIGQPVSAKRRKPVHKTALKDSALHTPNDSYQAQIALEPIEASKKVHVEAIRFFIFPGTWRKAGGAKAKGNIIDEEYKEGIYVGYRWADKEKTRPIFAFGHGLSYTTFAFSNLRADKKQMNQYGKITITVQVKNTGKRAGSETVQPYIHDAKASIDRPYKELKGFHKVYLLPGESKDVSITIDKDALSFYDEPTHSWKAEPGVFEALVGNAADKLKLKKAFELK